MSQDWEIKSRSSACEQCAKPFADREAYYSSLTFGEEGYTRKDACAACWAARPKDGHYSMWRGEFRVPPPPPPEPLAKETAETLLRKLMDTRDEANRNAIYILAVMLERKRLLVERDVRKNEDGTMVRVYEHRKSGDTFLVPDPRLSLDELEPVQRQVVELLGGDRRSEEEPAGAQKPGPPTADAAVAAQRRSGLKGGFYSSEDA